MDNNYHIANSAYSNAKITDEIERHEKIRQEYEYQKDKALFETASCSKEQNELLKQQLEFLQKQNEEQAKELKSNKIFQWISWGVTTLIAIASIVVAIVK